MQTAELDPLPPPDLMEFVGGGDFISVGDDLFDLLRDKCGVKPTDTLLDLGSGSGRVARPFTHFLTTGHYHGIDAHGRAVDWCRTVISERYPNFHFHHADVANSAYNPGATASASGYSFPLPDRWVDVAFAFSLFTHLLPADARRYASETARVLKPDGRAMLTFLLLNDRSRATQTHFEFKPERDGYTVTHEGVPESVVAFDEDNAREILKDAGLKIDAVSYGRWAGNENAWTYQDAFLVSRSDQP